MASRGTDIESAEETTQWPTWEREKLYSYD